MKSTKIFVKSAIFFYTADKTCFKQLSIHFLDTEYNGRWAGVKGPERKTTSPTETVMMRDEGNTQDKASRPFTS